MSKILITLTFLIAIFFLGKWVYQVWPRYEEKIEWVEIQEDDTLIVPIGIVWEMCNEETMTIRRIEENFDRCFGGVFAGVFADALATI
jgi:hypothetical protein